MQRLPNGLWAVPPRRREFYGLVHQLLPLGAGATQVQDNVQIDGQADFLDHGTAAIVDDVAAGQLKVQFIIQPDRNLFSVPAWIGSLGTGQFPRRFQAPQVIPRAQTFTFIADARLTVPAPVNVRVLHIGQKLYDHPFEPAKAYREILPYDFVANFTADNGGPGPLAAFQSIAFPVNVFADADFDIYTVAILADGDCTVQIETTGKALQWFNRPCLASLLAATAVGAGIPAGAWPFELPSPVRVPASGSIVTTIADVSGATNRVQVIFGGIRMKPPGGLPIDPRSLANVNVATPGGI